MGQRVEKVGVFFLKDLLKQACQCSIFSFASVSPTLVLYSSDIASKPVVKVRRNKTGKKTHTHRGVGAAAGFLTADMNRKYIFLSCMWMGMLGEGGGGGGGGGGEIAENSKHVIPMGSHCCV